MHPSRNCVAITLLHYCCRRYCCYFVPMPCVLSSSSSIQHKMNERGRKREREREREREKWRHRNRLKINTGQKENAVSLQRHFSPESHLVIYSFTCLFNSLLIQYPSLSTHLIIHPFTQPSFLCICLFILLIYLIYPIYLIYLLNYLSIYPSIYLCCVCH